MKAVLKSWRTSLVALATTILGLVVASKTEYHGWREVVGDFKLQMAAAVALLGFLSKDSGVTGPAPEKERV